MQVAGHYEYGTCLRTLETFHRLQDTINMSQAAGHYKHACHRLQDTINTSQAVGHCKHMLQVAGHYKHVTGCRT